MAIGDDAVLRPCTVAGSAWRIWRPYHDTGSPYGNQLDIRFMMAHDGDRYSVIMRAVTIRNDSLKYQGPGTGLVIRASVNNVNDRYLPRLLRRQKTAKVGHIVSGV